MAVSNLNEFLKKITLDLLIRRDNNEQLNIYDQKPVSCVDCGRCIGEVEYDAEVIRPKCGKCANPIPEGDDKIAYTINAMKVPR